ncbi:MAG: hypothetical protein R2867_32745 [Caldilineaceae bacterium]
MDLVGPLPHPALQGMFDALYPPGLQWYWKADFVRELPDAAIDLHVEYGSQVPTLFSAMHLYPIDGAAHAVGTTDTAWANRDARWAQVMVAVDSAPDNMASHIAWVPRRDEFTRQPITAPPLFYSGAALHSLNVYTWAEDLLVN